MSALVFTLWLKPPDILRVGANYSAKIVCSNVFLAGREPREVLRTDVQAPGIALLRLVTPFGTGAIEYAVPLRPELGDDPRGRFHIWAAARVQF